MAVLPDVLAPGLDLVFCGTAVSRVSAARGHPYANPGNRFWPTLKQVAIVPGDFEPARYRDLPALGLGYTDLNKAQIGIDSELDPAHFDTAALKRKLRRHRPRLLAFTSKNAGSIFFATRALSFGRQEADFIGIEIHVLPSPSGLAKSHWDIGPWRALARRLKAVRR
jgi:double-stranded uracil-DNA glycosylase